MYEHRTLLALLIFIILLIPTPASAIYGYMLINQSSADTGFNIEDYPGQSFITYAGSVSSINASLRVLGGGYANIYMNISDNTTRTTILSSSSILNLTSGTYAWYNFDLGNVSVSGGVYYISFTVINKTATMALWGSCSGNCYTGGSSDYPLYDMQFQVFGGSPSLYDPTNGSVITKTYPPLTSNINFTWTISNTNSNLLIAKDSNFNLIAVDTIVSTNYSVQALEAGSYWWKVRYYDSTLGTFSNYSNTFNFTLSNQQTVSGTNIQGTVYEVIAGTFTPISNARVYIVNDALNWSSDMVTGSNGYFLFSGLNNNTTYSIRATRTDLYQNSVLYYITTGAGTTTTQNILMEKCVSSQDCYFGTIDQSIMFQSYNGTFLSGYTVNIYEGDAVVPLYTLTTDSYGSITARLTLGTRYRLSLHTGDNVNLIDLAQRYIYPSGNGITITIGSLPFIKPTPITPPTNMTNLTIVNGTSQNSLANLTSTYLESDLGLNPLAQSILVGFFNWFVVGVGGPLTVIFTSGILAYLGVISWQVVELFLLTGVSLYVLLEMK